MSLNVEHEVLELGKDKFDSGVNERRFGIFEIPRRMIESDEQVVRIVMRDCIVVGVENIYARDVLRYTAIHPDFDTVQAGHILRVYRAIITKARVGDMWTVTREWR